MFESTTYFPVTKERSCQYANIALMPIFEYACNQCQSHFEKLLRSPEQEVDCPKCQSSDLRRLFSSFSSPVSSSQSQPDFCPPGGCGACAEPGSCCMN